MKLGILQQKLLCEAITATYGLYPFQVPEFCLKPAELICEYCGLGVCIKCNLNCYQCGQPLHDHCRDDHAKESGHKIDLQGQTINDLMSIAERAH